MRNIVAAVALCSFVLCPLDITAQVSDSLPFRAKQWAAEFSVSGDFAGAGLLRFRSKQSAWMLDAFADVSSESRSNQLGGADFAYFAVRGGPRWYRSIGPRVLQYTTVGPAITFNRATTRSPTLSNGESENRDQFTTTGAFGELGAAWLVKPQLSLGASWGASVSYGKRTVDFKLSQSETKNTTRRWTAEIGRVALRMNLYF